MGDEKQKSLKISEKAIWNFAKSLDTAEVDRHLILIIDGPSKYLFVKEYKLTRDGDSTFYSKSFVGSIQSISSEMIWDARDSELGYKNLHYELFSVKTTLSEDHWFRETLKNIKYFVTLARTKGNSTLEVDATYPFPPLNQTEDRTGREVRKFFRQRRLNSGDYTLTSISKYLIAAGLNPLALEDFVQNNRLPENYFAFRDEITFMNSLEYRAAQDEIEFRILITQDPEDTAVELVAKIKSILELIFERIDSFFRAADEYDGLSQVLGYSGDEFGRLWEDVLLGGFFEEHDGAIFKGWEWVRPDTVTISIMRVEIDPSRGIPEWSNVKIREYSETRSDWHQTNFAKIDPQAYLDRLEDPDKYPSSSWFGPKKPQDPKGQSKERLETALPIEELDFTVRTYNSLKREGVNTVGELLLLTEVQLGQIKFIGQNQIDEIFDKVSSMGLAHLIKPNLWPFE